MYEDFTTTTCCCGTPDAGYDAAAPEIGSVDIYEPEPAPLVDSTAVSSTYGPASEPAPAPITFDGGTIGGGHFGAPVVLDAPVTFDGGTIGGGHFGAPVVLDAPVASGAGVLGGHTAAFEASSSASRALEEMRANVDAALLGVTPASQPFSADPTTADLQNAAATTRVQMQSLDAGSSRLHTMSLPGYSTAGSHDATSPYFIPRRTF